MAFSKASVTRIARFARERRSRVGVMQDAYEQPMSSPSDLLCFARVDAGVPNRFWQSSLRKSSCRYPEEVERRSLPELFKQRWSQTAQALDWVSQSLQFDGVEEKPLENRC